MENRRLIKEFFSGNGVLSQYFEGYEPRKSQGDMAEAIYESLLSKTHIFIEAPTGIGKSFAYLVPALYYAKKYGKKAVVSTNTINLQEQLIRKDLPALEKLLPFEFSYSLLKGKNNYVCPNRLAKAVQSKASLFENYEYKDLEKIYEWAIKTKDGTTSDIEFELNYNVWANVCAEHGICSSKTCGAPDTTKCFYQKAKNRIANSDLVVVNHHLFFTLYQLAKSNDSDEGYLFHNDFVIFDEAQTVESVASGQIIPSVSRDMINYLLRRLYNPKNNRGFLRNYNNVENIYSVIKNLFEYNRQFFEDLKHKFFRYDASGKPVKLTERIYDKNLFENFLKSETEKLISSLSRLLQRVKSDLEENELKDYIIRLGAVISLIDDFINLKHDISEHVYWLELSSSKPEANLALCVSPVDISDYFRSNFFKPDNTCILTSATLSINKKFDYMKKRLGGEEAWELNLPTQFNFEQQVKLYITKDLTVPQKTNFPGYEQNLCKWILHFIKMNRGKSLVLFTNAMLMFRTAENLTPDFERENIEILIQGKGISRVQLLKRFKENVNSVLFGLDSFWTGIDVPGEALSGLIITRLPFLVPDHPLVQAKMEYIESHGGNSFMDYSLPEAIFKFRQGAGRLIRSKYDTGFIAVLDDRIVKKYYGRHFINSIDKCPIVIVGGEDAELQ
ncbi:MAG TPA: helicase C-terminal domain-containing protein [Ignavibacteria bacterium]|nr:helicase C-terminal domain-containing protein [Ignavibacteria bacterium]